MSEHRSVKRAARHEEMATLIPWYVNETLGDAARAKLEEHLRSCAMCREEVAVEERIRAGMSVDSTVEFMPAASLNRLRSMLDGEATDLPAEAAPVHRLRHWPWLAAASFAGAIAAVGLLAGSHYLSSRGDAHAPLYHTVTDSTPHVREEVVRAVFAPTVTLVELQAMLDEAQLRIVSGPTEAGVYSLAATSSLPIATSLGLLRRHHSVRFAESVEPVAETTASP